MKNRINLGILGEIYPCIKLLFIIYIYFLLFLKFAGFAKEKYPQGDF
jgi:hypothetical protein